MEILRLTVRVDLGGHTPVAIDATPQEPLKARKHNPVSIENCMGLVGTVFHF